MNKMRINFVSWCLGGLSEFFFTTKTPRHKENLILLIILTFSPLSSFSQTFTIPYQQNFDTTPPPNLPSGWSTSTIRRANGDFKTIASAPRSSPNAIIDSNSIIAQSLFSPLFDFSGKIGDSLIFFERRNTTHRSGILVEATINNDTTFPIRVSDTLRNLVANSYVRRSFVLPETLNNKSQIQFRWQVLGDSGTSAGFVRFDDISITAKIQYDAAMTNISFTPKYPFVGDSLFLIATMKNVGLNSLQNDTVKFYFDANNDSLIQQNELFQTNVISLSLAPNDSVLVEGVFPDIQFGNNRFFVQSKLSGDENGSNDILSSSIEVGVTKYSVVVNEIMYKPLSPEPEWIEIVNRSDDSVNLKMWKLSDKNVGTKYTITSQNYWLRKDSFAVVVKDSESFFEMHPFVPSKVFVVSSLPTFNNDSDDVVLFDNRNATIDSVHYKLSWGGNGKSLERIFADSSSLRGTNFGSCIDTSRSTPGKINSLTPKQLDASVSRLFIIPSNPLPRSSITLSAVVKNAGLNAIANYTVRFYRDENRDSIAQSIEEIYSENVLQTLSYRDSITISQMYDSIQTGENYFIAEVELIGDENVQNNFAFAYVTTSVFPQSVVVNEIMYAPTGDEPEWIELHNNTTDSLDLKNWKISDANTATKILLTSQTTILPPDSFVVLAKDTAVFNTIHSNTPSLLLQISQLPSFNNSGDDVVIYDASNSTIDSVKYEASWGGSNGGKSLERIFYDSLSNDSLNWGSSTAVERSTPGKINSVVPRNIDVGLKASIYIDNEWYSQVIGAKVTNHGTQAIFDYWLRLYRDDNVDSIYTINELIHEEQVSTILYYRDSETVAVNIDEFLFIGVNQIIVKLDVTNDEDTSNNISILKIRKRLNSYGLFINEIMYEPFGEEPEWIELFNDSEDTLDLTAFKISDANTNARIPLTNQDIFLSSKEYLVLTSDSSLLRQIHSNISSIILDIPSLPSFNNSGDAIVLLDETDVFDKILDSLYYYPTWGGKNGKSLERIFAYENSNDSTNWGTSEFGSTPGERNSLTPFDNDLKIKRLFSSRNGNQISLFAIIENKGLNTQNNFDVNFFDDINSDSHAQTDELVGTKSITNANLNWKDSTEVSIDWNTNYSGRRAIIATVYLLDDERRNNDTLVSSVTFSYPQNSIIVNEIMYEPLSRNAEYIELFNRSNDTIDIANWKISNARDSSSLPTQFKLSNSSGMIFPKTYFVLASDSSFVSQFPNFDTTISKLLIVNKTSLSLNNDEDDIVLLDLTNTAIDSIHYSYKWHNPELLSTQGHSLERINPNVSSNDKRNWSSSTNNGTPGKTNSIFTSSKPTSTSLSFSPNPFSPDGDGFEDFTNVQYKIPTSVASIRIRIFDVKGRMLRELAHNEPSGATGEIIWDGKDNEGKTMRIGMYIVFLEALDNFGGNVYSTKGVVVVAAKM